jgi:large subunit ribosomal protein L25
MPANPAELSAAPRTVLGKHVRRLRRAGLIPANIFGRGPSRAIQAPERAVDQLLGHGGRAALVRVAVDGRTETALLKRVQRDPRSGRVIHLDFQAVALDQTVSTAVALRFHGEAPAVAREGGVLTHPVTELTVEALASNLPEAIDVDLSGLVELHDAIKVGDLTPPEGVKFVDPPEQTVAVVLPSRVRAEVAAEAEAAAAEAEAAEAAEAAAEGAPTAEEPAPAEPEASA